jgi:hypothetical protein
MALPGFRTSVQLIRTGQTGQAADGSPTASTETIWTKLGHYQQQQGGGYGMGMGGIEGLDGHGTVLS